MYLGQDAHPYKYHPNLAPCSDIFHAQASQIPGHLRPFPLLAGIAWDGARRGGWSQVSLFPQDVGTLKLRRRICPSDLLWFLGRGVHVLGSCSLTLGAWSILLAFRMDLQGNWWVSGACLPVSSSGSSTMPSRCSSSPATRSAKNGRYRAYICLSVWQ